MICRPSGDWKLEEDCGRMPIQRPRCALKARDGFHVRRFGGAECVYVRVFDRPVSSNFQAMVHGAGQETRPKERCGMTAQTRVPETATRISFLNILDIYVMPLNNEEAGCPDQLHEIIEEILSLVC